MGHDFLLNVVILYYEKQAGLQRLQFRQYNSLCLLNSAICKRNVALINENSAKAELSCRADWIRTSDPYVPNVVRYRAALLPATFVN